LQTEKDIVITRNPQKFIHKMQEGSSANNSSSHSSLAEIVSLPPKPINSQIQQSQPSESLPVTDITRTLWQPDEQSVPDQLFKTEPTIAKLQIAKPENKNDTASVKSSAMHHYVIIPDRIDQKTKVVS
jgi:hypothetical protein